MLTNKALKINIIKFRLDFSFGDSQSNQLLHLSIFR